MKEIYWSIISESFAGFRQYLTEKVDIMKDVLESDGKRGERWRGERGSLFLFEAEDLGPDGLEEQAD